MLLNNDRQSRIKPKKKKTQVPQFSQQSVSCNVLGVIKKMAVPI